MNTILELVKKNAPEDLQPEDITFQRQWSDDTLGPGKRTAGVLAHIKKEVEEVAKKPTDLSEWIDLIILAIDGATRQGYTGTEVIRAYHAKMMENTLREWPPIPEGGFPEDMAVEHVRSKVSNG